MFSPLEQFVILPVFIFNFFGYKLIITNSAIILALVFLVWYVSSCFIESFTYEKSLNKNIVTDNFFLKDKADISNTSSVVNDFFFFFYKAVVDLMTGHLTNQRGIKYFPIIFFSFLMVLSLNVIGLIPYSFTITSHLAATFAISLALFSGFIFGSIRKYGILGVLTLFRPRGLPLGMLYLLTPVEFMSFFVKPTSLAIRLFANMMAGHTLLKVIAGFAFTLSFKSGILYLFHFVPLLVIIPLYGLEFAVALIQSYVFATLVTIYLNEALNLH